MFLGEGFGSLELFLFTDPELQASRIEGATQRLDHVAFEVDDLDALAATLRATGVRFTGPDRREELDEPVVLGTGAQPLDAPRHELGPRPAAHRALALTSSVPRRARIAISSKPPASSSSASVRLVKKRR